MSESSAQQWAHKTADALMALGQVDAAIVMRTCEIEGYCFTLSTEDEERVSLIMSVPRSTFPIFDDPNNAIRKAIVNCFEMIEFSKFSPVTRVEHLEIQVKEEDSAQEDKLREISRSKGVHNQGPNAPIEWEGLRFRSNSEVQIAIALDKLGVLFLPNCRVRLGTSEGRRTKEADFLICCEGKWGILEVDGEESHNGRYVQDQERDRVFKFNHIRVIEHFDSRDCIKNSHNVVKRFLDILRNS